MEPEQQLPLHDNPSTNQQPLQGSWTSEEPYPPVATHGHVLSPWRYNDLHWQQGIPQPLPPVPPQANPQPQIESGFSQAVNAPSNQGVTLEKVHPTQGPTAGGIEIWIAGRNFYGPLYVRFGDRSAPVVAVGVQSPSFIK